MIFVGHGNVDDETYLHLQLFSEKNFLTIQVNNIKVKMHCSPLSSA